jgi:hypothetical protein
VYDWQEGTLERVGWISEAKLRAWEYRAEGEPGWEFASGGVRDTVRMWKTARPDLAPERLFVGDDERVAPI